MKEVHIMESFVNAIEKTIFEEWKHEGYICGWSSYHVNFDVDGKEYVIALHEVKDGEYFSQYVR